MDKKEIEVGEKSKFVLVRKILIFCIIIVVLGYGYARYIGTSGLEVKEYSIINERIPQNFDGLKIVHFTDIHYGSIVDEDRLKNIVEEINKLEPDIVAFTGDLYDESIKLTTDDRKEISNILSKIETSLGKYAVSGNHDYSDDGYIDIINEAGFVYLNNESDIIYYHGNTPIRIVGFPSYVNDEPNYINLEDDYFTITLIHEPDAIDNLKYVSDVVFAGHSHGGQVRLPFIGALYTPYGSKKYYDEYYKTSKGELYISYGIGTSLLKIRYFNRPSINLYRLFSQ